jgi:CcmD family protein
MSFLYGAYVATWIIHIAYLTLLVRRYQHLHDEIEEMKATKRGP